VVREVGDTTAATVLCRLSDKMILSPLEANDVRSCSCTVNWKGLETTHLRPIIVSAYRYIAITTLAIIAVSLEYLRQFLIDLHQIYRHSGVP